MNAATLQGFRDIAATMRGNESADWQWIGRWESQRMFGITEKRAREYAARHGGTAQRMTPAFVPGRPFLRDLDSGAVVCSPCLDEQLTALTASGRDDFARRETAPAGSVCVSCCAVDRGSR